MANIETLKKSFPIGQTDASGDRLCYVFYETPCEEESDEMSTDAIGLYLRKNGTWTEGVLSMGSH